MPNAELLPNPPLPRRLLARLTAVPLPELLEGDVVAAAAGLLGCQLVRTFDDGRVLRVMLVETEAYHMREPGSHAYRGMTPRNRVMFGRPGQTYVYFTYGMWHCVNVVCEPEGSAAAVLLRAAVLVDIPAAGPPSEMPTEPGRRLPLRFSGPGLLCQSLELTREHSGLDLFALDSPLRLERPDGWKLPPVEWTTRIGFSFPDVYPWRAVWQGHPGISPGRPGVIVGKKRK